MERGYFLDLVGSFDSSFEEYYTRGEKEWCIGRLTVHVWRARYGEILMPECFLALQQHVLQKGILSTSLLNQYAKCWSQQIKAGKCAVNYHCQEYLKLCKKFSLEPSLEWLDALCNVADSSSRRNVFKLLPSDPRISSLLLRTGYIKTKAGEWADAETLFKATLNLTSTTDSDIDAIIGVYLKAGRKADAHCWCLIALERNCENKDKYVSLFWNLFGEVGSFSWAGVTADALQYCLNRLPAMSLNRSSVDRLVKEAENKDVVFAKHCYFKRNYRKAPMEDLAAEASLLAKTSSQFQPLACVWSFALDQKTDCKDASCFCSIFRGEFEYNCDEYRQLVQSLHQAAQSGRRVGALNAAHEILKFLQDRLKSLAPEDHDFVKDSILSHHIINALSRLSTLYVKMGVLKPARAYLEQAASIAKSMWPKRVSCWQRLEAELEAIDRSAVGLSYGISETLSISRPTLYEGAVSSEDEFNGLLDVFLYDSPHEFARMTFRLIRSQSLPIDHALGLLALSSALPFIRRDQAEQRSTAVDIVVADWADYVMEAGCQQAVVQIAVDFEDSNLLIANYETRQLLIVPAQDLSERLSHIDEILAKNKDSLFGHRNMDIDVADPVFKRTWWKTRQTLDTELASVIGQIDTAWLSFLPVSATFRNVYYILGAILC